MPSIIYRYLAIQLVCSSPTGRSPLAQRARWATRVLVYNNSDNNKYNKNNDSKVRIYIYAVITYMMQVRETQ